MTKRNDIVVKNNFFIQLMIDKNIDSQDIPEHMKTESYDVDAES